MAISSITLPNVFAQTPCPQIAGYKENGGGCFTQNAFGLYIISSEPFNPNEIVINFDGNGSCDAFLLEDIYQPCNNGSSSYAAVYNNSPYCEHATPTGTITFKNGTVCHYEDGLSTTLAECYDFVSDCKAPLIEFAQDFVTAPPNCKLWEGSCAIESEIWRTGSVRIGASVAASKYKLGVQGGITTEMLQICKPEWCDYVFADTYRLMPLDEVKHFIQENGYLPNITSAKEIKQLGGFLLEEEAVHQQEKIEEIFLYLIQAQHRLNKLDNRLSAITPNFIEGSSFLPAYTGDEYPSNHSDLLQIECFQIKPAPDGIGGITLTGGSGPYNLMWNGPSSGNMNNITCTGGAIQIQHLVAGPYSLVVSNASGVVGTCSFTISTGGLSSTCDILSDPFCKQAILKMLEDEAYDTPPNCKQWEGDPCSHEDDIYHLGNVGIGTSVGRAGYSLAVKGGIVTDKFRVELCERLGWCDYVFEEGYPMLPLLEAESYIKNHKHLPGTITQNEVTENGGFEMRSVKIDHQVKIEEAYLHLIALNKQKEALIQKLNLTIENN